MLDGVVKALLKWLPWSGALMVLLSCGGTWEAFAEGMSVTDWEARYLQIPDQKPEWTAAGRIPKPELSVAEDGVVQIDGRKELASRGIVLLGSRFRVPGHLSELPAAFHIRTEYQAFNHPVNRTASIVFMLYTADCWDVLAAQVADLPCACVQIEEANVPGSLEDAPLAQAAINRKLEALVSCRDLFLGR